MQVEHIKGFGDLRRDMLQDIERVRNGDMPVERALALAAHRKVFNDNIQVEINAAKMSLLTEGKAHSFGKVVGMGRRLIGNDINQEAS